MVSYTNKEVETSAAPTNKSSTEIFNRTSNFAAVVMLIASMTKSIYVVSKL